MSAIVLSFLSLSSSGCGVESQGESGAALSQVELEDDQEPGIPPPAPAHKTRSPRAMPNFVLEDLAGNSVMLSDYEGKAVLVNFWATWCAPCRAELPDLVAIQEQYGGDRFTVIGVSLDQGSLQRVEEFIAQQGLNYPILMGNPQVVVQYGNFQAVPTSFLLNAEHELARRYTGMVSRKALETDLAQVFES